MAHIVKKKLPTGSKTAYPALDHMKPEKQAIRLKKAAVSAKIDWLAPMSWKRYKLTNPLSHPTTIRALKEKIMKKFNSGDVVKVVATGVEGIVYKVRKRGYIYYRYTVIFEDGSKAIFNENEIVKTNYIHD